MVEAESRQVKHHSQSNARCNQIIIMIIHRRLLTLGSYSPSLAS